jgi:DNA-directed RNA polymerase sigma subunit (sigma70/sigma32)
MTCRPNFQSQPQFHKQISLFLTKTDLERQREELILSVCGSIDFNPEFFESLRTKDIFILAQRMGFNEKREERTFEAIGNMLGCSRQYIHKRYKRIIKSLQQRVQEIPNPIQNQ